MLIKGSRIKLVKPISAFTNVGEICEVVKVDEDGVISFRFGKNGVHLGCMSYDEFEKYFELVEKEDIKRKWSNWEQTILSYRKSDEDFVRIIYFRENGKKVQVKYGNPLYDHCIRSEATCHKDDEFNLEKGFKLAEKRLFIKILQKELKEYTKTL